jgi:hypothetical protein
VKSGTNTFHGSGFEYLNNGAMRARNHFLPAGQSSGTSSMHVFGGTVGGPIVHDKFFFFFSDESTRVRTLGGNPNLPGIGTTGYVSVPTAALRTGDFSQTGTVLYDPNTGTATGTGRVPFAFANCPGVSSTTDPAFAGCNYIPANRINPVAAAMLARLVQPTLPGFTNNYFATTGYDSTYHKLDAKIAYTPNASFNLNARVGFLPNWETQTQVLPAVDGSSFNPLSEGRAWQARVNSDSVGATHILTQHLVADWVVGFTKHNEHVFPPDHTCAGAAVGILNACQPPNSLDTAIPNFNVSGWFMNSLSQVRYYVDPQAQVVGNLGWTKGSHSLKFGIDVSDLHQNHYETQVQDFTFNGGSTSLSGGTAPNSFNRFAD